MSNSDKFVMTVSGKVNRKDAYEWWDAEIGGVSIDGLFDWNVEYASITLIVTKHCINCSLSQNCEKRFEVDVCDKWSHDS